MPGAQMRLWTIFRNYRIIALAIFAAVLLAANSAPLVYLEQASYDLAMRLSAARRPGDQLLLVTIDDADIAQLGPWPWDGGTLVQGLRELDRAGAEEVVYLARDKSVASQESLGWIRQLTQLESSQLGAQAREILTRASRKLNRHRLLADLFSRMSNVSLSLYVQDETGQEAAQTDLDVLEPHKLSAIAEPDRELLLPYEFDLGSLIPLRELLGSRLPGIGRSHRLAQFNPGLAASANALGVHDPGDGRFVPLIVSVEGRPVPSISLLVAARSLGLKLASIAVYPNDKVLLGDISIPVTGTAALPFFYGGVDRFQSVSFRQVLNRDLGDRVRGKTVLVGTVANGVTTTSHSPVNDAMPEMLVIANSVAAILNDDLYHVPKWASPLRIVLIIILGLFVYFLPRIGWRLGAGLSLAFAVILVNLEILALVSQGTWLQLMVPTAALLAAQTYLLMRRVSTSWIGGNHQELSETYRKLGQAYQSQGQYDLALECFRKCEANQALVENIFNLALDFERKRQFGKAIAVYKRIKQIKPDFEDIDNRIERMNALANRVVLSGTATSTLETMALNTSEISKPMLGRYEIQEELGRGAMGIVYLGRDPKINRTVAIKTLALAQEFEGEELEEVKQHFYREAETAGRLSHPNIVTIYDVGDDQELAYIAMDYLSGENLQKASKRPNLFPWQEVFEIIIKVAEAIDYAHCNHVVHRDIKPANIIYDKSKNTVKVTDFGVAHVMGTHKTKTGTILGSPSYMSPEQVQGKKVDGRADIWSLGVTLYQMLSGVLPFRGQPLATLMYQIANDKHEDISVNMPGLPKCVTAIINKSLQKDPAKRYQSGTGMAGALKLCLQKSSEQD